MFTRAMLLLLFEHRRTLKALMNVCLMIYNCTSPCSPMLSLSLRIRFGECLLSDHILALGPLLCCYCVASTVIKTQHTSHYRSSPSLSLSHSLTHVRLFVFCLHCIAASSAPNLVRSLGWAFLVLVCDCCCCCVRCIQVYSLSLSLPPSNMAHKLHFPLSLSLVGPFTSLYIQTILIILSIV